MTEPQSYWTAGGPAQQPTGQGIVVREYRGKLPDASRAFQHDASIMASSGYYPISQVYQPGSYGCGAFLVALILFVVLVGILVFLYMILVKPPGSLMVTYQWRPPDASGTPPPPPVDVTIAPSAWEQSGGLRTVSIIAIIAVVVIILIGLNWR